MTEEQEFSRGASTTGENLKAFWEMRMNSVIEQGRSAPREELAEPFGWWDIFALGPFQNGALVPPADLLDQPLLPNRIIQVGEEATIITVVLLNPFFPDPSLSACDIITGFGARIELNYFTSNTQTMMPVPALSFTDCFAVERGICVYVREFTFTPRESACLFETNICARICDCTNQPTPAPIQPFAAFVRWIVDPDFDLLFGSEGLEFDRPIRYMVSDFKTACVGCPD